MIRYRHAGEEPSEDAWNNLPDRRKKLQNQIHCNGNHADTDR